MFFMVTYGSICLISLLENFASSPGYRPVFKSKWYVSLLGTIMCIFLMFRINSAYALLAIFLMVVIYFFLSRSQEDKGDIANIFSGVIFQVSRNLHVFLQKRLKDEKEGEWRPSVVSISKNSFDRHGQFDLLRWISHRKGFGMFIHHVQGYLSKDSSEEARLAKDKLIKRTQVSNSSVFVDTMVNPTYEATITQALQLPGVSGKENNLALFEFKKGQTEQIKEITENCSLIKAVGYDTCILASSDKEFGYHNEVHIWLTSNDYQNANLMNYLAYIILGHPDWKNGFIKLFAVFPEDEKEKQRAELVERIQTGRLPISMNNIEVLSKKETMSSKALINKYSSDADLTVVGFRFESLKHVEHLLEGYDQVGNVLFVNSQNEKEII
jgi:hypothetical protein